MRNIHAIYFTCANHYEELKASLKSLIIITTDWVKTIYIYCDANNFFNEQQLKELRGTNVNIIIRKTYAPMSWGGVKTIELELHAFNEVRKEIHPNDYIMNVDSDLILISDNIFETIAEMNADIIGQPIDTYFRNEKNPQERSKDVIFQQGSCYFIKASFVLSMIKTYIQDKENIINYICSLCFLSSDYIPPDITMNRISELAKGDIQYVDFFVGNKSAIHMELTKNNKWIKFAETLGLKSHGDHVINHIFANKTIPKKIHYCWFGGKELPIVMKQYIEGWKKKMPDYEIKEWNEQNSPMNEPYICKMYPTGKWARIANWVRLYALYTEGGIYLDTDIEVIKPFDDLLNDKAFMGFQFDSPRYGTGSENQWVNNAVMGGIKGLPFFKMIMDALNKGYNEVEMGAGTEMITNGLRQLGLDYNAKVKDFIKVNNIKIYSMEYFYPYAWDEDASLSKITDKTYCIHHWFKSWIRNN